MRKFSYGTSIADSARKDPLVLGILASPARANLLKRLQVLDCYCTPVYGGLEGISRNKYLKNLRDRFTIYVGVSFLRIDFEYRVQVLRFYITTTSRDRIIYVGVEVLQIVYYG